MLAFIIGGGLEPRLATFWHISARSVAGSTAAPDYEVIYFFCFSLYLRSFSLYSIIWSMLSSLLMVYGTRDELFSLFSLFLCVIYIFVLNYRYLSNIKSRPKFKFTGYPSLLLLLSRSSWREFELLSLRELGLFSLCWCSSVLLFFLYYSLY